MPRLYLQVEIDVFEHPKVLALAERFGLPGDIGPDLVVAFLERWWGYCAKFGSDGRPADCPRTVLISFARALLGRSANPVTPDIVQELRSLRLMDRYGHPWDWQDFTGALLRKRAKDADRQRTKRGLSTDKTRTVARREEKSTSTTGKGGIQKSSRSSSGKTEDKTKHEIVEKAARVTWLTPYDNLWREAFAAALPFGEAAKVLKPLVAEHGDQAVQTALRNYLAAHHGDQARYISLSKFGQTFGEWRNGVPSRGTSSQQRSFENIDRALGEDVPDGE